MTPPALHVYIGGEPVGQPRARHIKLPGGKVRVVSTADKDKKAYRAHVIAVMKQEAKRQGWAVPKLFRCDITSYFATKRRDLWGTYCGKKPDRDNIDKLILDCAGRKNGAGIIKDDAGAADGSLPKLWSETGGVLIVFRSLDGVEPPDPDRNDLGVLEPSCGRQEGVV